MGACGVDARPKVAAVSIHPWEEPPISGTRGSGTIFFSGCTLKCLFCQNYPISQLGVGRTMGVEELAEGMLTLQRKGAHNLNLVTATHQMAAVVQALLLAIPRGFRLPLVHNGSGYERVEVLELLDGIVDIYLPDIKYADPKVAQRCSGRSDYVAYNRRALLEMWRQVGPLKVDADGIACRGLLVRHLVLPEDLSGTRRKPCLSGRRRSAPKSGSASCTSIFPPTRPAIVRPSTERSPSRNTKRPSAQFVILGWRTVLSRHPADLH